MAKVPAVEDLVSTILHQAPPVADFHDRRIEFTLIEPAKNTLRKREGTNKETTQKVKAIVELSGGILRLVSPDKECCLYRFWSNACRRGVTLGTNLRDFLVDILRDRAKSSAQYPQER